MLKSDAVAGVTLPEWDSRVVRRWQTVISVTAILAAFAVFAGGLQIVAAWTACAGLALGAVTSWNEAFGVGVAYGCSLAGYALSSGEYILVSMGFLLLSGAIYLVIFFDDFSSQW